MTFYYRTPTFANIKDIDYQTMDIIKTSPNGQLSYCDRCKIYQLEFGNLFFRFTTEEFLYFKNYIRKTDGSYYEEMNKDIPNNRKIFLRMPINGFYCCLHNEELDELKYLISIQKKHEEKSDIHFSFKNYSLN